MKVLPSMVKEMLPGVVFLLGFLSGFPIIQIAGVSIQLYILYSFVFLSLICGFFSFKKTKEYLPFAAIALISSLTCILVHKLPMGYQLNNIKGAINVLVLLLFLGVISSAVEPTGNKLKRGIILATRANAFWMIVQFVLWTFFTIDVNQLLFVDIIPMVERASQFKQFGLVPTGFCWNVGGIAAIMLFGFQFEENYLWKVIVTVAALLSQSMSLIFGVSILVLITFIHGRKKILHVIEEKFCTHRGKFALILLICIAIGIVFFLSSLPIFKSTINGLLLRINSLLTGNLDSSTSAHLGYYVNLPLMYQHMNPIEMLIGYGSNCSGYLYSELTGQYAALTWIIESDYINILLNYGLLGLCGFFYWIVALMRRVSRDERAVILVLLLIGLLYNFQMPAVILIEMVLLSSCRKPKKGLTAGRKVCEVNR